MPQCTVSKISHFYALGVLHLFIFSKFLPTVRPLCNVSPTDGFEVILVIRDISEGSNATNSGAQDGFWPGINDIAYCTLCSMKKRGRKVPCEW